MALELTARTEPGARLVALAETLADEIGPHAADHDRDASFPFDSFAAVKQSGYFTAPVPEQLGGLGVTSVHDVLVASSRLARGDAALTLGVNMHLVFVLNVVRRWRDRGRSGRRATRSGVRRDARADRARRHRLRVRRQRARAGPHPAGDDRDAHRDGLDRLRPQGLLHDVACRRRPLHRRHLHRRPTVASGTATRWSRARRRASSSTTTGTRSACAPRAATRSRSRTCGSRSRRCAAASRSATRSSTWSGTSNAGLFHAAAALGIAESAHASVAGRLARRRRARPARADARGREPRRPLRLPRRLLARRGADRRAPRAQPDLDGHRRGADQPVRRGAEREGCSSARPPSASSTARSRSPAEPAT